MHSTAFGSSLSRRWGMWNASPSVPGSARLLSDYYAYHSPARDAVVCLIEVVNGAKVYETSYVRALDAGWHVAPAANSDTHAADWLTGCECRTVVLAPRLTREDLYDALRNRRVYATQDSNLDIAYTINESVMGSILSSLGPLDVAVRVLDPDADNADDRIATIDLVSNGGVVVESRGYDAHSAALDATLASQAPAYYFVRVTNAGGEKAYTAPIWVGERD